MRTAVDSSVLLDVLTADAEFGEVSARALKQAWQEGALIACDVVWAEVRAVFERHEPFSAALEALSVEFDPLSSESAATAGELWHAYCRRQPRRKRSRVVADFLIGSHALHQADRLLARDRGFWREGWGELTVIDPSRSER